MPRVSSIASARAIFLSVSALVGMATFPPTDRIAVGGLIPLTSRQKEFRMTQGRDRGKLVPMVFSPDSADEKKWSLTFGTYGRIFLLSGPGGALMVERIDLFSSKNSIVYEPALPLLPGDANSGGAIQSQVKYRMFSSETRKLKRSGQATHLVKPISHSQFETPAGRIDGYYIEIEHRMEMEYYSHVLFKIGLGCRLDEGPVYGSAQYTVRKLGLFTETKTAAAGLATR